MDATLNVVLTRTYQHKPLATIRNLPGNDADLTPDQMRALAKTLLVVADECEARPMDAKRFLRATRSYAVADLRAEAVSSELRAEPCPWCGSGHDGLMFRKASAGIWVVSCPRCGAVGPHPRQGQQSYDQAIAAWNGEEKPACTT